jgi:hypothetical protein
VVEEVATIFQKDKEDKSMNLGFLREEDMSLSVVFRLLSVAGVRRYEEREGIAVERRERISEIHYSMDIRMLIRYTRSLWTAGLLLN